MRKCLFLFAFLALAENACAADSITLTTYYPAPAGSYQSMRSTKMCIGTNCHNGTAVAADNNLYVQGNIGIGTATPKARLDVAGEIKIGRSTPSLVCSAETHGTLRYDSAADQIQYCNQTNSWAGSDFPSGAVMAFYLPSCPAGWAPADGTSGTPDLRGVFLRGLDNGRGLDTGRTLGSYQIDEFKSHSHSLNVNGQDWDTGYDAPKIFISGSRWGGSMTVHSTNADGSAETRPKNVALLYCIKN